MVIPVASIEQGGPGIDLSNQPEGVSVLMSDPVRDLEYARNAVTLVYDLRDFEHLRLRFKALEFGDEPHGPKDEGGSEKVENEGVFGPVAGFDFDGVAVSADGVSWYEIQGLRGLRSDKFTAFDIDLDAAVSGLGLAYNGAFRIRFCQYDDNPAPMDGISIAEIELAGDLCPPVFHLSMDDNAANSTVTDSAAGHHDQVLLDTAGDPNTQAHSVPGRVGTALALSNTTYINCGAVVDGVLAANQDFAISFWWKSDGVAEADLLYIVSNRTAAYTVGVFWKTVSGNLRAKIHKQGLISIEKTWAGGDDGQWHHYVTQRRGTRIEMWRDGVLGFGNAAPVYAESLVGGNLLIGRTNSGAGHPAVGTVDDFRVYDRALIASEIQALAGV